jgi:ketosteroid isomerase-like protein
VRRFAECWTAQDWDATAGLVHPDVEMVGTAGGVEEGRITRGVAAIRGEYERVEEMWDEHTVVIDDVIDGGDRVVLFHHEYQRGRSSGVEVEIDAAVVFELRDGRIVRMQGYMDRAAALRAAGLGDSAQQT